MNIIDHLTGAIANVDQAGYDARWVEASDWHREHFDGTTIADMDPLIVFTDGSFRIVRRADLDCSPLPEGRTRPACTRFDQTERGGDAVDRGTDRPTGRSGLRSCGRGPVPLQGNEAPPPHGPGGPP